MIQSRNINGSLTEIYVGGGNYITQSFPTNFHQFWSAKILTAGEKLEDFKEVTAAERAQLEAQDAKWVRPEQWVIDQWNNATIIRIGNSSWSRVGQYNPNTGYFELGHQVFTEEEAKVSLLFYPCYSPNDYGSNYMCYTRRGVPAILLAFFYPHNCNANASFGWCDGTRVIVIRGYYGDQVLCHWENSFNDCMALVEVCGEIELSTTGATTLFNRSPNLEIAKIYKVVNSLHIAGAPKLNFESFSYLVETAANTDSITVTVHDDVYAALNGNAEEYPFNGGSREQWTQLLQQAAERQILFAVA